VVNQEKEQRIESQPETLEPYMGAACESLGGASYMLHGYTEECHSNIQILSIKECHSHFPM
jgi:hypothetical protein